MKPWLAKLLHHKITPVVGDLPKGEALWMVHNAMSACCHAKLVMGPRGQVTIVNDPGYRCGGLY